MTPVSAMSAIRPSMMTEVSRILGRLIPRYSWVLFAWAAAACSFLADRLNMAARASPTSSRLRVVTVMPR